VNRPRAADDFAMIRARMEELQRERGGTKPSEEVQRDPPLPRGGAIRLPPSEIGEGHGGSANLAPYAASLGGLAGLGVSDRASTRYPAKGRRSIGTAGVSGRTRSRASASSPITRRAASTPALLCRAGWAYRSSVRYSNTASRLPPLGMLTWPATTLHGVGAE